MFPELTNLLSPSRMRAFRRMYFMRLAVVGVFLLCGLIVAHAVLLTPTYLFASAQTARLQHQLDSLTANLQTSEEQQVNARLGGVKDNVTYLTRMKNAPTASAAIRAVLTVPRTGISVNGITFTPGPGATNKMALTGMASSRDTLRQYQTALSALPFVTNADLPISSYAKEVNIPFTITLTGTLVP